MLRFLLLGLILLTLGHGLNRGWIILNWDAVYRDTGLRFGQGLSSPSGTPTPGSPTMQAR